MNLTIKLFTCNALQENCYVVSAKNGECIIIDCGAFYENDRRMIAKYIQENELKPVHLIATHGHADHLFGCKWAYNQYGLKLEIPAADLFLVEQFTHQAAEITGVILEEDQVPEVGKKLSPTDTINVGEHTFTIIETPGHSPGSVFFYCAEEKVAFSGDTLFKQGVGRTDLPGGSMFEMIQTLRMISQLPDDVVVYPGHGLSTTIGNELAANPYLDR